MINYDKEKIHYIKDFIYTINPLATILETEYSNVSLDFFLEENAINTNTAIDFDSVNLKQVHSHEHFHEKEKIENLIIRTKLNNKFELDSAIGNLIWNVAEKHDFSIIRFKGIFYDVSNKLKYSLQGLYDLYEINEIPSNNEN